MVGALGDILLMVDQQLSFVKVDVLFNSTFRVYCPDFFVETTKLGKMERLKKHALLVRLDTRSVTRKMGRKSNCIYFARLYEDPNESWTVVELGQ